MKRRDTLLRLKRFKVEDLKRLFPDRYRPDPVLVSAARARRD